MAIARRFLIASSLTRLIRKERGAERVIEGHFAPQSDRQSHVRIEKGQSSLVLSSLDGDGASTENWTDVPRTHAEALVEVCPGTVTYERSRLRLSDREILVDRFVTPASLDLVSVEFATQADADAFSPPVWFGPEITHDHSYKNRAIAIDGRPSAPEAPLSNAALEAILDLIEGGRPQEAVPAPSERNSDQPAEDSPFEKLRRLAAVRPASPLPKAPASAAGEPEHKPDQKPMEGVARLKPRRSVPITPAAEEDGDERLAGVIQGLSEALSKSPVEKDERFGS